MTLNLVSLPCVRRENVTEAAGKLQVEGLNQHSRGNITMLDRPKLEAQI